MDHLDANKHGLYVVVHQVIRDKLLHPTVKRYVGIVMVMGHHKMFKLLPSYFKMVGHKLFRCWGKTVLVTQIERWNQYLQILTQE